MSSDLIGHWRNQNGSLLIIDSVVKSLITGRFQSAKGRAARDEVYPVIGCVNDEIVTFTVDFRAQGRNLHSVANFSGRREGKDAIHTTWILARQYEDRELENPTQPWNTFIVNADVFAREEA